MFNAILLFSTDLRLPTIDIQIMFLGIVAAVSYRVSVIAVRNRGYSQNVFLNIYSRQPQKGS